MAIVNDNSMGSGLSGGLGPVYYRKQNGKTVVCQKPAQFNKPMDKKSVSLRSVMSTLMNISKVVTKDSFFHPLWKVKEIKGMAGYHKFVSFNHPHEKPLDLENVKLLPVRGELNLSIKSTSFSDRSFHFTLNAPGNESGINFIREPFLSAGGFLILSDDLPEKSKNALTVPLKRMSLNSSPDSELSFTLKASVKDYPEIDEAKVKTIMVLVSSLNSEEQPVKHSATFLVR